MSVEYVEKETYIYMDFNGKINADNLQEKNTFFRIADLDSQNPVVQLNDMIYKGKFDDCIGTNLFFEEEDNTAVNTECFKKETSISLKYLLSQTKILSLKCVKINSSSEIVLDNEEIDINLDQDYNECLRKLAAGELYLEDLHQKPNSNEAMIIEEILKVGDIQKDGSKSHCEENEEEDKQRVIEDSMEFEDIPPLVEHSNKDLDKELENIQPESYPIKPNLLKKYEKLKKLASMPVYRETEPELVQECEEKHKESYEYHNIEHQIFQRSNSFPVLDFDIDERTLRNAVDIDRCVLQGVVEPSVWNYRTISKTFREKLLKIDNFDNLSLPARYFVLKRELEHLEDSVVNCSEKDLETRDKFGRTPKETLYIFRKLVANLGSYLSHIHDDLKK